MLENVFHLNSDFCTYHCPFFRNKTYIMKKFDVRMIKGIIVQAAARNTVEFYLKTWYCKRMNSCIKSVNTVAYLFF